MGMPQTPPAVMMTLVLLPGMDGTGSLFNSFVIALGSRYTIKVVSYPPNEPLDYAELEARVSAALPTDGPFVILGESFSGPIAVSLAASCPSRLKGLILCCSFVRNPYPFAAYFKPFVDLLPITEMSTSMLRNVLLGRFASDALHSALASATAQVSKSVIHARMRAVISVDVSQKLAAIEVPILYLRASHDHVIPRRASELMKNLKPEMRVVELDAPHFLLQAAPVEAAIMLYAFVREFEEQEFAPVLQR